MWPQTYLAMRYIKNYKIFNLPLALRGEWRHHVQATEKYVSPFMEWFFRWVYNKLGRNCVFFLKTFYWGKTIGIGFFWARRTEWANFKTWFLCDIYVHVENHHLSLNPSTNLFFIPHPLFSSSYLFIIPCFIYWNVILLTNNQQKREEAFVIRFNFPSSKRGLLLAIDKIVFFPPFFFSYAILPLLPKRKE